MNYDVDLIHITRNGHLDCVHRGRVAVVDHEGRVRFAAGDGQGSAYLRSIAKPFQAAALFETSADRRFHLTDIELAIIAGSHSGTPKHTDIVARLLTKLGLEPKALHCGVIPPLSADAYRDLLLSGHTPTALHHNCSGKHSGMLACCLTQGWALETYTEFDHPVQTINRRQIADSANLEIDQIELSPDGCSVPTFGLPLVNIAQMMANFGIAIDQAPTSPLGIIGRTMQTHPLIYSGEKRIDADIVRATRGEVLVKDGAEGIIGLTVPKRGMGIALKISDGNQRAIVPTLIKLLKALDCLSEEAETALTVKYPPYVFNVTGQVAAQIETVFDV